MASFGLSFFPLDVLDEIWDLIESVSEGFLTYSLYDEMGWKTLETRRYNNKLVLLSSMVPPAVGSFSRYNLNKRAMRP